MHDCLTLSEQTHYNNLLLVDGRKQNRKKSKYNNTSCYLEGLKVARPLSRKSNLEAKPVISDGHLKFCTTTHNLWMATVKQRSYQQLS